MKKKGREKKQMLQKFSKKNEKKIGNVNYMALYRKA